MRALLVIPLLWFALVAQQPAESPVPSAEPWLSGTLDFGYRVRSDVGGNSNVYRSVVNLGEGPKLFGLDVTFEDPHKRLFDRLDVRANNWGGDPYNTAHLDARKQGAYNLSIDYRNIAYFNFLPSFANPSLERGVLFSQRAFDIHRRLADVQLDLLPGKRIVPYLACTRDSGFGGGVTTFVSDANEYPVANDLRDKTDHFRGGVRLELNRFHATLEQGGTTFKDDQRVFTSDANFGNRTTPLLDQRLFLSRLQQAYGVRGDSIYSKVLLTANPVSWANLYGQFLYSRPQTDVNYIQNNTGNFVEISTLLFYGSQQDLLFSQSKQPHTSGSFGAELRPMRRVRILESWMTDRLHTASFAQLTEQILLRTTRTASADRLVWNYNQQQVDLVVDVTSKLTLRGGHRYVWGDARTRAPVLSATGVETGELSRHAGIAGFNFRPSQKLRVNADFEGASSDHTYFRTSLHDYQKLRARARFQPLPSLSLSANFTLLNNQNPIPTINYDFLSRDASLSLFWTAAKRVSVSGEYSRSSLRSDITYVVPQSLNERERSFYRDNAHTGTALVDLTLPGYSGLTPRIGLGGSFFVSSGSRPSRYYQPLARFALPLHKQVQWTAEWRWYGFGERFYQFEGFRAHVFMTGLRVSR
jgi:hypothetical protein